LLVCSDARPARHRAGGGFTFAEIVAVVVLMSLMLMLSQINIFSILGSSKFEAQADQLVSTMRMTIDAAAESDRRFEVIIDLTEQSYILRKIDSSNLSEVREEEIIEQRSFNDDCWVRYVEFDDATYTSDGRAKFRAGRAGWQYGGKIVLQDRRNQIHSIVVNRLNGMVKLVDGDAELLETKSADELLF